LTSKAKNVLRLKSGTLRRLKELFYPGETSPSLERRAVDLIAAIDAGGLPLHAGIVNDIARKLGLDVAATAPMELTIARIRAKIAQDGSPNA
jgi:hypothetical protein